MLSGKNIYKNYGTVEVLRGVDIDIQKGEIVSIVGSSGAGKSTLLHILGTLDKADRGYVKLNETTISEIQGKRLADFRNKYIGFVFQFHHLLPEFTAGRKKEKRGGGKSKGIIGDTWIGGPAGK
jgi:lipoprotein-releasing system ATP-binding protein